MNYEKHAKIYITAYIRRNLDHPRATIIILQNNLWEIWVTLDLWRVTISQNMDLAANDADTTSKYYPQNMGHPEPIKIVIIKVPKITENLR